MRTLTAHEQRTIRIGGACILVYLLCFGGLQAAKWLSKKNSEYQQLVVEARSLKAQVRLYEDRAQIAQKLMEGFRMDPVKLSRPALVVQASAAIQKTAMSSGVQVGAVREAPARSSSKELATIQLEATGPVPGLMNFLHQIESVGYPVVVDSIQITSDPARPGPLKMSLMITILDFDQWKKKEAGNAAT